MAGLDGLSVLVTGASGFIGARLCRALTERGARVRAFHRPTSNLRLLEDLPVEHAVGDLTQPETLEAALTGVEAVFHAAAWMGDRSGRLYTVTVEGTRALLRAAQAAGVRRVVHTSSCAALGVPALPPNRRAQPAWIDENHSWPVGSVSPERYPYGYAKYLAEMEVQKAVAAGLDVVIVNPTLVLGAGDVYRQSSSIVAQVARRRAPVSVEGGVNVVHLDDVVDGHLAAFERGQRGQRYLLGAENFTHHELVTRIARLAGAPAPAFELPGALVRLGAGPAQALSRFLSSLPVSADLLRFAGHYFFYDTRKAHLELGLPTPRPVDDAIREALEWFGFLKLQS